MVVPAALETHAGLRPGHRVEGSGGREAGMWEPLPLREAGMRSREWGLLGPH